MNMNHDSWRWIMDDMGWIQYAIWIMNMNQYPIWIMTHGYWMIWNESNHMDIRWYWIQHHTCISSITHAYPTSHMHIAWIPDSSNIIQYQCVATHCNALQIFIQYPAYAMHPMSGIVCHRCVRTATRCIFLGFIQCRCVATHCNTLQISSNILHIRFIQCLTLCAVAACALEKGQRILKVSSIVNLHRNLSSELTFENLSVATALGIRCITLQHTAEHSSVL